MKRSDFLRKGLVLGIAALAPYAFRINKTAAQPIDLNKSNTMSATNTAKELLLGYLENIHDPSKAIELFADDATIELPYLASLGLPWQWQGKETIHKFLVNLPKTFPGFGFSNISIHIDTPDQAFGEYDAHCKVASTGRAYNQTYMGRLVAENGKIKLLREALDMAQVAKSMFPNGVADLGEKKD
ncbi:nuclear transport factor 2 family protein [Hymenobacter sp. YC55]|uniref:nuclear transport factor 2 family protein n=1 Tax=Hymenobacter sp. YC55 TaxID=3034019 RepID=UPI0023FA42B9|nr:nuclear transport factor 2 family protein [Hymenobacter sp. YC55]MDF7813826.1 nuclear transport factor 2 family protein [Hymenobacter sp. YC55]